VTAESADGEAGFDLGQVFAAQEKVLWNELTVGKQAGQPSVQGGGAEDRWLAMLGSHLPKRYEATRGIVVDSKGHRSEQIDVVLHDRQYSPLWWEYGDHRYVPAESVYAVFEVKQDLNREHILYAAGKVASVRALDRTSAPFGWAMGTMKAMPTVPLLGGLLAGRSSWVPPFGNPFREAMRDCDDAGRLDLGCVLGAGTFELPHEKTVDDVVIKGGDGTALVSFLLTLLHRLQGLGSAPAIKFDEYERWIATHLPE
jgi:hypothetical protein